MYWLKPTLFLILLLGNLQAFSQKTLYLKPFIGLQNPYCHFDRSVGKLDAFSANKFVKTDNFGLLIEYPLNDDWTITGGFTQGNIGWGHSIQIPEEITYNPANIGLRHGSASGNYIYRLPILLKKNIKYITFLELDPNRDLYLLVFDFYAISGLSFDVLAPLAAFDGGRVISGSSTGDFIDIKEDVTILSNKNVSAWFGVGTQFYHRDKPRLDLTLFYSQGFKNMLAIDVNYQMNNVKGHTRLLTRGAVLGLTLGYPIRLKTFKQKPEA